VNNRGLVVNGTVRRSPVAAGADLVGYSVESTAAGWLSRDFAGEFSGNGSFMMMFWSKGNPASQAFHWHEVAGGGTSALFLNLYYDWTTGQPRFVWQERFSLTVGGECPAHNGAWAHHVAIFNAGTFQHFMNGVRYTNRSHGITAALHELRLFNSGTADMALLRVGATIPTADQIRRIYEDEKALFQENAACTLYGSSDAVTALAHDPVTGLLHVGTSAGRSIFKGFLRVHHTATAVATSISAVGGLIAEK